MSDQTAQGILGLLFLLFVGGVALVVYVALCGILWRLGRKFRDESFLAYCIPLYQCVLMCRCADVSGWHAAAMCIPVVNYGATVWIFGNIARRMGKSFWGYGLGVFLFVPLLVLAFGDDKPQPGPGAAPESPAGVAGVRRCALSCVQGEMAGAHIEIPAGGLVIGRNPQQAQVVLTHPHVSAMHARVWAEPVAGGVRIWTEDLHSMNGTSFRRGFDPGWTALKGSGIALNDGDMIRLADGAAEFRVVGDSGVRA